MAGKRTTARHQHHHHHPPPPNPSPNRRRGVANPPASDDSPSSKRTLAFHFLRALARIHSTTPAPRRPRTIRRAAYSSMARAASPRRAWTQALLLRLRRARSRRVAVVGSSSRAVLLRRRVSAAAPMLRASAGETSSSPPTPPAQGPPPRQAGEPARADALRRLVPGGAGMEYCSLLDETADYVRSLRAQVQLMQSLVDLFSPPNPTSN